MIGCSVTLEILFHLNVCCVEMVLLESGGSQTAELFLLILAQITMLYNASQEGASANTLQ
jgi:hypothetical protein